MIDNPPMLTIHRGWKRADPALVAAFDRARHLKEPKPRVIICDTKMAKGVPFLEARERNHFLRVEAEEWVEALDILDKARAAALMRGEA